MNFFDTSNIHLYIAILLSIFNGGILAVFSSKFLQVIQQSGYKMNGYFIWLRGTRYKYLSRLFTLGLLSLFCVLVTNALLDVYHKSTLISYVGIIFYFYFSAVFIVHLVSEPNKIPLVRTKRVGRIFVLLFIMYSLATFYLIAFSTQYILLLRFGIIALTPTLVPFFVIIAFYIILPLENFINKIYIQIAKRKLAKNKELIKIAIAGEYGKTITKLILQKMLEKKYETVSSKHSYNTQIGLTRVILNNLNNRTQVFIAELGEKKKNNIKELCELINPSHAIITSYTNFNFKENIKDDSIIIFNGDNAKAVKLYDNFEYSNKIITQIKNKDSFVCCKNVKVSTVGTGFDLCIGKKVQKCKTNLVGVHNLENIALCAAMAYKMGVSLNQISQAIQNIEALDHRMKVLPKEREGMVVIDNTNNKSFEGVNASLETLNLFKGYKKIIITPGFTAMGKRKDDFNTKMANKIANVCDYVIIVNEINQNSIRKGLKQSNFAKENIYFVHNKEEAKKHLKKFEKERCVVLFENDLPDLFIY